MAKRERPQYDVLKLPEDEPIVLSGEPGDLRGAIEFYNPGEQKVILREARLHGAPTTRRSAAKKADKDVVSTLQQSIATTVLRPGQSRQMPLNVAIDRHTPPGEYRGEIEVNGHTRPVVYHVAESVALDIAPLDLIIENRPGQTITKQVFFTNEGNVPLSIGEIGAITLDQEYLDCITGRAAVTKADEIESMDQYYVELARENKRVLEETGFLRVRNKSGLTEVQPGETQTITLEIRVPEKLNKRSRYFGVAPFYLENLRFIVVPAPEPTRKDDKPASNDKNEDKVDIR
jgi:hypothetical protein